MKNQQLALTATIGSLFLGGIIYKPELLPPAQAMTISQSKNGTIIVGIGESVRSYNKKLNMRRGATLQFVCQDRTTQGYDALLIRGNINDTVSTQNGSTTQVYQFKNPGYFRIQITNSANTFSEWLDVYVK
jgi:hypothetical protein